MDAGAAQPGLLRTGRGHYLTPSASHRALGLVCLGAGTQDGPIGIIRDRALGCHAVVVITRGSGWVETSRTSRRDVAAPGVVFLPPGVRHSYGPHAGGWTEHWALFEGRAVDGYAELGFLGADDPVLVLRDPVEVYRVLGRLEEVVASLRTDAEVESAALVHELLVAIRRGVLDRSRSTDVLSALRDAACSGSSVAGHARRLRMSERELRAAVRTAAGCTPQEFLLRVRITEAKSLLAETDASVSRIAALVGYADPAYFSRLFTRRVGRTPRGFRREQSRPGADAAGESQRPE